MRKVFLDTSFILSYINFNDELHENALKLEEKEKTLEELTQKLTEEETKIEEKKKKVETNTDLKYEKREAISTGEVNKENIEEALLMGLKLF